MKKSLNLLLLLSLLIFPLLSLPIKAQTGGGTFIHYVKLGHWQGSTFVEDETLPASNGAGKVEVWTQPTSAYDNGKKVATGDVGKPISLPPGKYRLSSKVSLPSGYDSGSFKEANCPDFEIQAGQTVVCTFQAYKKSDSRNYEGLIPSSERPSGAPPMVEVDSSLGSYQFIKNVVDISADVSSGGEGIISVGFATLYNKKVMLVGTRKNLPSYRDSNTGYTIYPQELKLLIYDVTNPFNPRLLKENLLPNNNKGAAILRGISLPPAMGGKLILDNHPFIYGGMMYSHMSLNTVPFIKINEDWSLSEAQDLKVKWENGQISSDHIVLLSMFNGIDRKPYGLVIDVGEGGRAYGCKIIKVVDLSNSPAIVVGEIKESDLGIGYCEGGVDYGVSKTIEWRNITPVLVNSKLYLVVPTFDTVGRLHVVERSWVSVFDFTSPSNPQFVGKWQMSGLNSQEHFPDASEVEKIKIYADAGLVKVDQATGYVYDIFPHMGDYQNAGFMTSPKAVEAFYKINGSFRYRNGIIIRKINSQGNFDYVSRYTLCEKEGAEQLGGHAHTFFCGSEAVKVFGINPTFDKAFYGIGGYIGILPSPGTHAYNGVVLLRDLVKSSVVAGLVTSDDKFKVISDSSDEFLKFADSLSKVVFGNSDENYGKYLLDAHLQQVDNKTFAIFQIHPASIDVVKLTLTQPRPLPSDFSPQSTTTILTTASATPSTGALSPIQGTLYSIRSILNNLRRILNR